MTIRGLRSKAPPAGILLLALFLFVDPVSLESDSSSSARPEGILGRLEAADSHLKFGLTALNGPGHHCPEAALCWDPSTGQPGSDQNSVFYGQFAPSSQQGSFSRLLAFNVGNPLKFVSENARTYDYSIVRVLSMSTEDPRFRGYAAATPGHVVTLIDCPGRELEARYQCEGQGGEAVVVRAEDTSVAAPSSSQPPGRSGAPSWLSIPLEGLALLVGHVIFLLGLLTLAWCSLLSGQPNTRRLRFTIRLVPWWTLLGLLLTEAGPNYSATGRLEIKDLSWLWGWLPFLCALLFLSHNLGKSRQHSGLSLLLPAAALTSLGLIAIYYWEAKAGGGHTLFFTQAGASVAGLIICSAAIRSAVKLTALSMLAKPVVYLLAGFSLGGLALVILLVSFNRPGTVPALGPVILSPALEVATVICLAVVISLGRLPDRVANVVPEPIRWFLWFIVGFALLVLLATDLGVGVVLTAASVLIAVASRVELKRIVLAGALLAVTAVPIVLAFLPGNSSLGAQARLEAWLDPDGFYNESEQANQVAAAFRNILGHQLDQHLQVAAQPSGGGVPQGISANVAQDVDRLALELSYRLYGLRPVGGVAQGLVAAPTQQHLLLAAEDIWSGVGGYDAAKTADLDGLAPRVNQAISQLRTMAANLERWEQAQAPPAVGLLQRPGLTPQQVRSAYLDIALAQPDNFQQRQSLLALHDGRLLGTGWGLGEPELLPAATEDQVFALVGESTGLLGAGAVVVLFVALLRSAFSLTRAPRGVTASVMMHGLAVLLALHALLPIAGILGILPFTGISLPFVSRGGASLVASWAVIALLVSASTVNATPRESGLDHLVNLAPMAQVMSVAGAVLVAGLAAIQLTGHAVSPGDLWLNVNADRRASPAITAPADAPERTIVDRDGRLLVRLGDAPGIASYPDPVLATSLSHSLLSLQAQFHDPPQHPLFALLGGRFWRAKPVGTLVTSVDSDIQMNVHRSFDERLRSIGLDPEVARGAAVVLDATTGEVLALESRPAFDPQNLSRRDLWAAEEADSRNLGIRNRFINRAVEGTYSPGSTFKVVTLAAALESGLYTPDNKLFRYATPDPSTKYQRLDLPDGSAVIDDNHPRPGEWSYSVNDALVWSNNVAFADMARTVGPEAIIEMAKRFGFEQKIAIPGLGTSLSSVDSDEYSSPNRYVRASDSGLAHTGYGQGNISVTPVQMAMVAAAVANHGVVMEPSIVRAEQTAQNEAQYSVHRAITTKLVRPEVLPEMQRILWSSVTDGWARDARVNFSNREPGVAGKTGTAEWSQDGKSPNSWFIGYYPAEHPRIAVAVLVEEAGGSHLASFVARDIFGSQAVNSYIENNTESALLGGPPTGESKEVRPGSFDLADGHPSSASLTLDTVFARTPAPPLDPAHLRTVVVTGDIIPGRHVDAAIRSRGNDFLYPVAATARLTADGDLTVVNLEAPLIDGCPPQESGLNFCGQKGFVDALQAAGVDIATLENNHVTNYGSAAVTETKKALEERAIASADRNVPAIKDVRGIRFGFLAFNGVGEAFDRGYMVEQIKTVRAQVDVLIVAAQWGAEYSPLPAPAPGIADDDPVAIAHIAIDAGADLLIGNGPHHVQPIEIYKGKLVTYAHGNFIFDQMWSYETRVGVIGRYTFYDDTLVGVQFQPTLIEDYAQPRLLEGMEAQAILDDMRNNSIELSARLGGRR